MQDGKLRALAVSGDKRLPVLPNVPTFAEAGLDDLNWMAFFGLIAPAGTPQPVIAKLNAALKAALSNEAVRNRLATQQATPIGNSPAEFSAQIARDLERMRRAVTAAKIEVELTIIRHRVGAQYVPTDHAVAVSIAEVTGAAIMILSRATLLAVGFIFAIVADAAPVSAQSGTGSSATGQGTVMMMAPGKWSHRGMRAYCNPQAAGFGTWRVGQIEQIVKPDQNQRKAFEEFRAASDKAAQMVSAACPVEVPQTVSGPAGLDGSADDA